MISKIELIKSKLKLKLIFLKFYNWMMTIKKLLYDILKQLKKMQLILFKNMNIINGQSKRFRQFIKNI